jgi:hypothetical protein
MGCGIDEVRSSNSSRSCIRGELAVCGWRLTVSGVVGRAVFVPKGLNEGSLARSAWKACHLRTVPLGYGMIGITGRAIHNANVNLADRVGFADLQKRSNDPRFTHPGMLSRHFMPGYLD